MAQAPVAISGLIYDWGLLKKEFGGTYRLLLITKVDLFFERHSGSFCWTLLFSTKDKACFSTLEAAIS